MGSGQWSNGDSRRALEHSPREKQFTHKRKRDVRDRDADNMGVGATLALLKKPDLPGFNITSKQQPNPQEQGVEEPPTKKGKKIPKRESSNYPAITYSTESRLQSKIKISDLQGLVLYLLADGPSPQWISVRHRPQIRKTVVLMIPGLEQNDFRLDPEQNGQETSSSEGADKDDGRSKEADESSPDSYYPIRLKAETLPYDVRSFVDMFEHVWPVRTPGDDKYSRMHSPLHAMLSAPISKSQAETSAVKGARSAREPQGWQNKRTPITEYISSIEELLENDYIVHPACHEEEEERDEYHQIRVSERKASGDGWVDTNTTKYAEGTPADNEVESGSITAGREVLAMDCEMVKTDDGEFSLARISIIGWDGSVVMDELVKPDKPIADYLTMYSGMTEAMLAPVTTTLKDIQHKLLITLHPKTILIGHSLNSDLTALKLTHPFIIDTSMLYPHPRGPPLKSSLKYLAQKYLGKEIQKGGASGHDSIEDARTCLDLVKQKCEKGPQWGTSEAVHENLFKRLARAGVRYKSQGSSAPSSVGAKSSAAIDWGNPKLGAGNAADFVIGCKSDDEVVEAVIRAVKGDSDGLEIPGGGVDFVWARMRELEALRGWWNNNKVVGPAAETAEPTIAPILNGTEQSLPQASLETLSSVPQANALSRLTQRIKTIHEALPPCTALIIYSGSGDPREMARLQQMQQTFKREYKVKKWDQLSVKWTDVEEQALRKAAKTARNGIGFVTVK